MEIQIPVKIIGKKVSIKYHVSQRNNFNEIFIFVFIFTFIQIYTLVNREMEVVYQYQKVLSSCHYSPFTDGMTEAKEKKLILFS